MGAFLALGLGCTACGDVNAASAKITQCTGDYPLFNMRGSDKPVDSVNKLIGKVSNDVVILHSRSQNAGGNIDLANFHQVTEIESTPSTLALNFPDGSSINSFTFEFRENKPVIAQGAVVCSAGKFIFPNRILGTLEQYIQETNSLSR